MKSEPSEANPTQIPHGSSLSDAVYTFGEFTLDCGRFELRCKDKILRLERKPLLLLIRLAAGRGALVSRPAIAETLWDPQTFVDSEHGINTAIRKIRAVLKDDPADPRYIKTVIGLGYRFIMDVRPATPVRIWGSELSRIGIVSVKQAVARHVTALPSSSDLIERPELTRSPLRVFPRLLGFYLSAVLLVRTVTQRLSM